MKFARFVTAVPEDRNRRFCPTRDAAAAALLSETPAQMSARLTRQTNAALRATGFRAAEGESDVDLRRVLDAALRAIEPGYLGIDEVFPDEGAVIYSTMPKDVVLLYKRAFAIGSDGVVTFVGERQQVQVTTEYEPVAAATARSTRSHMETIWDIRVPPNGWAIALEKRRAEQGARPASSGLTTDRKGEDVYRNPPNGWQIALAKRRAEGR
jgi:hypothetical protein